MGEYERWGAYYAKSLDWEKHPPRSTISAIVRTVLIGSSFLFALLIIEELTGSMVLEAQHRSTDVTELLKWHCSLR